MPKPFKLFNVQAPVIVLKVIFGGDNIPGSAMAAGSSARDLSEFRILYPNLVSYLMYRPR